MLGFLKGIFNWITSSKSNVTKYRYGKYIPYNQIKWKYFFITSCNRKKPYTIPFPDGVSVLCKSSIGILNYFRYVHDWKMYGDYRNHKVVLVHLAQQIMQLYKKYGGGHLIG